MRVEHDAFTGPSAELAELAVLTFGRRVRDLRTARGWTQAELASALSFTGKSYHQTTIAKLENGARPTSVEEVHLLAALLDVEVVDLFRDDSADALLHAELARQASVLANLAADIGDTLRRADQMKKDYARSQERYDELLAKLSPEGRARIQSD